MFVVYIIASIWTTNFFTCTSGMYIPTFKCMDERPVCNKDSEIKTLFYLFTSRNKMNPEALHKCDLKLPKNTYFNSSNPTVFFTAGYLSSTCVVAYMREMKDELLKRRDYNVILVDWQYYTFGDYSLAYGDATDSIGDLVNSTVNLINNIKHQANTSYKLFHLIGHSLGAHASGIVGQRTKVFRITALDPAGPMFYDTPEDKRLDRNDADFVDVMHTNAGRCLPFFGYKYPLGDEDFYVEGGSIQLSCYSSVVESFFKFDVLYGLAMLPLPTACFHLQSIYYFKTSINAENNCCYLGKRCRTYKDAMRKRQNCAETCGQNFKDCSIMGMDWPLTYRKKLKQQRSYFVKVEKTCPFCFCHLESKGVKSALKEYLSTKGNRSAINIF